MVAHRGEPSLNTINTMREILESGLAELSLDVSGSAIDALLEYTKQLDEWSRTYNLVAPRDRKFLLQRHILDSLSLAPWLKPGTLLDVGTGAGLPGLPLAIIDPHLEVTLLDSVGKSMAKIQQST